ncbi:MAG TPA: hypothetical protein EYP43_04660 [Thermoplasmata archaeon]|nr:hypothetical protein [Thermoplasmata archaeon]
MRLVFTSDLHGSVDLYRQLAALVDVEGVDAVVLGGDLFPSGLHADQEGFFREHMELILAGMDRPVYAIMGNNDWRANAHLLDDSPVVEHIHWRAVDLDGWRLFGYAFVDVTPFPLKDWEKWDDGERSNPDDRLAGIVTWPERREIVLDPADRRDTIERDLRGIAERHGVEDTIFVFHAPPHGTPLDLASRGHIGSVAIRRFVEMHSPPLTLHGHIHEAPHRSGSWAVHLGRSLAINPGQRPPRLHAAVVDLDERTARHTLFDGTEGFGG